VRPLQLFLRNFDELVLLKLVALHDVFVGHFPAGVRVHLEILDAVACLAIELIERDLFGFRGGRIDS
jgi:hypothetical protein